METIKREYEPELGQLFTEVYNKHKTNGYTRFMYRFFNLNLKQKPIPWGSILLIVCWGIGTLGIIIFNEIGLISIARIFAYILSLFFLFILTLPAFLMNQLRIRRIIKELGITPYIYNYLAEKYIKE